MFQKNDVVQFADGFDPENIGGDHGTGSMMKDWYRNRVSMEVLHASEYGVTVRRTDGADSDTFTFPPDRFVQLNAKERAKLIKTRAQLVKAAQLINPRFKHIVQKSEKGTWYLTDEIKKLDGGEFELGSLLLPIRVPVKFKGKHTDSVYPKCYVPETLRIDGNGYYFKSNGKFHTSSKDLTVDQMETVAKFFESEQAKRKEFGIE